MTWFVLAILSVIANSAMFLVFKRLQFYLNIEVYLFYAWLIASVLIGINNITTKIPFTNERFVIIILAAGFCSWIGNYAYNYSISMQNNLGYIEALSSIRIGLTYIASLFLFSGKFDTTRLTALIGIVFGCFLVSFEFRKKDNISGRTWIFWSLLSGLSFATLALLTKLISLMGISIQIFISCFLLVSSIFYLITGIKKKYSFNLPTITIPLLLSSSIFAVLANVFLFNSYAKSPNLAYPVAISNARVVLLFIASIIIGKEKINPQKTIGIIIIFVSAILLA